MIAIDTSSLIAYLNGSAGFDVEAVDQALGDHRAVLPLVVLAELLSEPRLDKAVAALLKDVPLLPLSDGYWERAGLLRASLLSHRLKARLADTLIVQSCIDHGVPLVARDADFRHFVRLGGLKLVV